MFCDRDHENREKGVVLHNEEKNSVYSDGTDFDAAVYPFSS